MVVILSGLTRDEVIVNIRVVAGRHGKNVDNIIVNAATAIDSFVTNFESSNYSTVLTECVKGFDNLIIFHLWKPTSIVKCIEFGILRISFEIPRVLYTKSQEFYQYNINTDKQTIYVYCYFLRMRQCLLNSAYCLV